MKKILCAILLLAILLPLSTWAQPYLRLPARGAAWMMEEWSSPFPGNPLIACFYQVTAGLDTVQGYPVTAIHDSSSSSNLNPGPKYIHEDSTGKGYLLLPGSAPELLYDYGATVGQSMIGYQGLTYTVDSIDTVTFADGIPRKRLYVSCFCPSQYGAIWIEGMGDILNGPSSILGVEARSYSLCYAEYGVPLAVGTLAQYCSGGCVPVSVAEARPLQVQVFPQPARQEVQLACDAADLHVRLLALDGRVLRAWTLAGAQAHVLALGDLVAGLYVLEVRDAEGRMAARRVMVE